MAGQLSKVSTLFIEATYLDSDVEPQGGLATACKSMCFFTLHNTLVGIH